MKIKRQKSKILARSSLMSQTKGELTTQQIIMLIIVITSFVVILFLLFRLNLGETSNKEICYNSVVLKSTAKGLVGRLDCKTNYVCISGGGKCEGINPTTTVKVNLDNKDEDNKDEIMKAIADEMADCWWMFGEGKLNYLNFKEEGVIDKTTCAICSTIKFDDKILEKDYIIRYREFYNYLNSLQKDSGETYFSYLYDSFNVDEFQETSFLQIDIDTNFILDDEKYAIVTGVKKDFKIEKVLDVFTPVKKAFMYPYYVKSSEISSELGCDEFITKA